MLGDHLKTKAMAVQIEVTNRVNKTNSWGKPDRPTSTKYLQKPLIIKLFG